MRYSGDSLLFALLISALCFNVISEAFFFFFSVAVDVCDLEGSGLEVFDFTLLEGCDYEEEDLVSAFLTL